MNTRFERFTILKAPGFAGGDSLTLSVTFYLKWWLVCTFIRALVSGGTVEGTVDDDVLVRFGELVVQVPPEWLEAVEE